MAGTGQVLFKQWTAAAVAMLLSALFIRHRDIKPIWEVGLQILFYITPVLYVVTAVPARFTIRLSWKARFPSPWKSAS